MHKNIEMMHGLVRLHEKYRMARKEKDSKENFSWKHDVWIEASYMDFIWSNSVQSFISKVRLGKKCPLKLKSYKTFWNNPIENSHDPIGYQSTYRSW